MEKISDYSINYVDGSYRIVTWHVDDFMEIAGKITNKEHAVIIDECLYVLGDIRAIIKLDPIDEESDKKEESEQPSDEYGFLGFEEKKWLAENMGIDIDKGGLLDD